MVSPQPETSFEELYSSLEALPRNMVGQIINGSLHANPRPSGPHGLVASTLGMDLGTPYQRGKGGPGGWWIIDEPELHMSQQVLVPDIAGWRHTTLPAIPQDHRFTVAPNWVCEVLSPSTSRVDRVEKMPVYATHGVEYLWLVDPADKTMETFTLIDGRWTLTGSFKDDDTVAVVPFEAAEISLADLWKTQA